MKFFCLYFILFCKSTAYNEPSKPNPSQLSYTCFNHICWWQKKEQLYQYVGMQMTRDVMEALYVECQL